MEKLQETPTNYKNIGVMGERKITSNLPFCEFSKILKFLQISFGYLRISKT